ncbi:MAG: hypothetical protein JRD05_00580 [Deltaproteobacteria bacterium]|nr:hypothetical protein [Deltaproteobacteria bacterium]
MYLIISKDGGFHKQSDISDEDKIECEQCRLDIVDIDEPRYPKYYSDGEWFHV